MDMTLNTAQNRADGIFSVLTSQDGAFTSHTLEHAYQLDDGSYGPKLVRGQTYTCKRGMHRLHGMTEDFETFEVLGVPDFQGNPVTGLLFHWGNWNKDSEGCILTGEAETSSAQGMMVTASRDKFAAFMQLHEGEDTFQLTVL